VPGSSSYGVNRVGYGPVQDALEVLILGPWSKDSGVVFRERWIDAKPIDVPVPARLERLEVK